MARLLKEGLLLRKLNSTARGSARKAARALASTSWHSPNGSRDVNDNNLAGCAHIGTEPALSNGSQFDLNWQQSAQPPDCQESGVSTKSGRRKTFGLSNKSAFRARRQLEGRFADFRPCGALGVIAPAGTLFGTEGGATQDRDKFTQFYLGRGYATAGQPNAAAAEARPASSDKKLFNKILIANRGEIACRVIKSCRRLGIKTVAVHSEPDADALHVRMADEAVCVGPAASTKSYLNIDAILAACKSTGAEAVHPGYGFLSENSAFVERLEQEGIKFVGPTSSAIAAMGDKIESKELAKRARVNTIPGFPDVIRDAAHAAEVAKAVGYPVMMKASAGGGGKGMRIAWSEKEVMEQYNVCHDEAVSSFGDGRIFIEKFIEQPRHIEIQLIADSFGNTFYLPERECSIQRRNQKVIEEAPSTFITPETRKAMGEQAVQLAKAVGYQSAGTVEFLVDKHRNFYFLEMNTRLQVEHPVTELITGLDLVELMLKVAAGQKLNLTQERACRIQGWALESRVYAEDPRRGFLPSNGRLRTYSEPRARPAEGGREQETVRLDTGVEEGSEISIYYDPLICKLSTHGPTREAALESMEHALDSYVVRGLTHNIPFLRSVISDPDFRSGNITTKFIQEHYPQGWQGDYLTDAQEARMLASAAALHVAKLHQQSFSIFPSGDPIKLTLTVDAGQQHEVVVSPVSDVTGEYDVKLDGSKIAVQLLTPNPGQPHLVDVDFDGKKQPMSFQIIKKLPRGFSILFAGSQHDVLIERPDQAAMAKHMPPPRVVDYSKFLRSPMPGALISVAVKEGQNVSPGAELAVVEAMKMRNVLRAEQEGVVKAVSAKVGSVLAADQVIIEFE
ncbi:methylcrotonoyl-CoA carboxylase subunit alpha [Klebsormidium nitens]|uniref:Methylcrotonoyl-CoA carboxylase subunit alpha n=1 Tax=Klebsormidium nitens TaxID=105231 RepID=A0A1Y1IAW4_KLENI|nr:methylcrotonoyl-CoA carboxylase subunit alpha [Klebsormidium nitens]|eukprot:GAQ88060.1 methylcrotonoyl-CoA carboxylase subunit alpha [Klebsormidium nitens]